MNVAEYIAKFLVERKVRHVFGYQGGAILKLIDAIVATGEIQYVQNFHEQASAFCADAYSRVTGNIGVALATSGPGATNLITGIANAHLDSIPTLFITGQEYSSRIQKMEGVRSNGFQDLDIVSVVKTITKYATTITNAQKIAYELEKAVYLAESGRPGAVLLDIPIDLQFQDINLSVLEHFHADPVDVATIAPDSVDQFISILKSAQRPVVLGGGGIDLAHAREEFRTFVAAANLPVTLTLNGLDCYADYVGFSGLYGNVNANLAVLNADVLFVMGARLGQHQVGKSKSTYTGAKIVHIDIDPLELGRCMPEVLSIQADLRGFLIAVTERIIGCDLPDYAEWHSRIAGWGCKYPVGVGPSVLGVSPHQIFREAQRHFDDDTVVAADVGQNQMWAAQTLRLRGRQRLLNSSGLGSMGYALPAAIAAKLCRPAANVVAFIGDGGFQMNIQELQLIALKRLNIKIFVFNNGTLGLIKSTQDRYFGKNHLGCASPDFDCVDLRAISGVYGLDFYRVAEDVDIGVMESIFQSNRASLVEVVLDPDFPLLTRNDMTSILDVECFNA